jgi:hypothetical protein
VCFLVSLKLPQNSRLTDRVGCDCIKDVMQNSNQATGIVDCLSEKCDVVGDYRGSLGLICSLPQFILSRFRKYDGKAESRLLRLFAAIKYIIKPKLSWTPRGGTRGS